MTVERRRGLVALPIVLFAGAAGCGIRSGGGDRTSLHSAPERCASTQELVSAHLEPRASLERRVSPESVVVKTGLLVREGEVYRLSSTGVVKDGRYLDTTSARGYPAANAPFWFEPVRLIGQVAMRHRGATWFALVGYVSAAPNAPFEIGDGIGMWTAHSSGELVVFMNDAPNYYANNSGCITLRAQRLR